MPTINTNARNAANDAVGNLLDGGSTNASGARVLQTSGAVEVATLVASDPFYGASASGVKDTNAMTSDTNATGGTVAQYSDQDRDRTEIMHGTVTASGGGGELIMSSLSVGAGDTVEQTSASTMTMPAS